MIEAEGKNEHGCQNPVIVLGKSVACFEKKL